GGGGGGDVWKGLVTDFGTFFLSISFPTPTPPPPPYILDNSFPELPLTSNNGLVATGCVAVGVVLAALAPNPATGFVTGIGTLFFCCAIPTPTLFTSLTFIPGAIITAGFGAEYTTGFTLGLAPPVPVPVPVPAPLPAYPE
ncbi:hypothetical protein AX774_g1627, partial [Zancudomyces culisetae]